MKQEVLHEVTHREFSYIPRVMASVEIKSKSSLAKTEIRLSKSVVDSKTFKTDLEYYNTALKYTICTTTVSIA